VISRSFDRETAAVFAGIREHQRKTHAGTEIFELRRRIHMVEKGLTMQPRRDTFAVAYIGALVDRLRRALELDVLEEATIAWARDVLDGYFVATSTSSSPIIAAARLRYERLDLSSDIAYCGPAVPLPPEVEFDPSMLATLAQHRRSVRWYQNRPVAREIVDEAVSVAIESPTACNRVPYRFELFDDPSDAQRIASIAGGTTGYVQNLQSLAVVVGDLSAYLDERDRHLIYIDGSLASMGFIYSLESNGVASCCINWPDLREPEKKIASLLGLASHERVVMLIAYGYADPSGLAPASPKFSLDHARRHSRLER
jgi:nitroreductase